MSITVALVDASLLSLRRASGRLKMVGRRSRRQHESPSRRRRPMPWLALVLVSPSACFTWRRRNVTLGDLLAGAKDVPSGCTVACILFVHFVHTVKASRKAYHEPGAPVKSTASSLSLFLHVRASPKRRLTYTWMKKDLHETVPKTVALSFSYSFFDQSGIHFLSLFLRKLRNRMEKIFYIFVEKFPTKRTWDKNSSFFLRCTVLSSREENEYERWEEECGSCNIPVRPHVQQR